ncbi:basic proline-rich protein-like [Mus pahari]|uniref:basic proline-rich protein-like n=1 Tax=Mus pahari TaxID=10093 RepID=UPI000A30989A|nr:basic proline-rich protein-like [Mus pahari]
MGLRPDAERGSPESWTRPTKTRGGREVWQQVRGREAPSWGGGDCVPELVPDSLQRGSPSPPGSSPEPVPDRPGSPPRIPSEPVPDPPRSLPGMPPEPAQDPPGAGPCPGAPRAAQDKSVPSRLGYARLYRLGGAPIGGDARDPAPGPALRSAPGRRPRALLSSRPPSPCLGPGLALVRPLAPRAWIDLVALASGSRNRPASTARLPIPGAQPARRLPSLTRAPRAPAAA